MRSRLFTDGERYVCQGTAVGHELSINDQVMVQKLKKGVTDEQWLTASAEERKNLVESVVLGGSALGFREVAPNSCCTIWNSKNIPKGYTSLSEHQRFLVDFILVKNFVFIFCSKLVSTFFKQWNFVEKNRYNETGNSD